MRQRNLGPRLSPGNSWVLVQSPSGVFLLEQAHLVGAGQFGQALEIGFGQLATAERGGFRHGAFGSCKFLSGATPIIAFVRFHWMQTPRKHR